MKNIDKNYEFFLKEESKLNKKYPNQFLVISNQKVVFNNKDMSEIIKYVKKKKAGTYIIQKCGTNENDNIQMFHTRVKF